MDENSAHRLVKTIQNSASELQQDPKYIPRGIVPSPPKSQSPKLVSPVVVTPTPTPPPADPRHEVCDNPACNKIATIVCGICNEAPPVESDPLTAQYCSSACQKADLMRHGVLCSKMQDRVTLYRVMELALKQLYVYRELSWHAFDVEGVDRVVEEKEGTRYETVIVRGVRVKHASWPDDYRVFPAHLMRYKEDREALLVFLAKFDAVVWATEWIHGLLAGVVTEIVKIVHEVNNVPRRMVLKEELTNYSEGHAKDDLQSTGTENLTDKEPELLWEEMNCEVLKVTMRSGEEFAIDLAAAQYGYFDTPVIEWAEYKRTRTISITTAAPPEPKKCLSPLDYRLSVRVKAYMDHVNDESEKDLLIRHIESLSVFMMEWQFDGGMSLKKLWEAPEDIFKQKVENLNDYLECKLHQFQKANNTVRGKKLAGMLRLRNKWNFNGKMI